MRRLEPFPGGDGNLGFQIAPMIDVVFVIMLFFMVMAGAVKVEREINTKLPGTAEATGPTEFVDELVINVAESGEVLLNDEPMDDPKSTDMPQLRGTLMRLKQTSDAAKSPVMVTIISETEARYHRTVDVLNALAAAQISNVTFSVTEEE